MSLRDRLRDYRAPGEDEAGERGWRLVESEFAETRRRRRRAPAARAWRPLAAAAAGAVAVGIALTPAGAALADWVGDVVERDPRSATPAPLELPGGGRLLVNTDAGPWVIAADGSKRLLGGYSDASWSPGGLFVVAARGREISALEPGGRVRWQVTAPARIRAPRWSPSGFRIAYLSGRSLRVVAGDGTGDRPLAAGVALTPAAWRPAAAHVLAFADSLGRVRLEDTDSGRLLWRSVPGERPRRLAWSADGDRLVALGGETLRIFAGDGRLLETVRVRARELAFAPKGRRFALVRRERPPVSDVVLLRAERDPGRGRRLFAAPGAVGAVEWSPSSERLLIPWDGSDQWVFTAPGDGRRVRSYDRIAARFDAGDPAGPQRPQIAGWVP